MGGQLRHPITLESEVGGARTAEDIGTEVGDAFLSPDPETRGARRPRGVANGPQGYVNNE
jgi:hypothetical protein